MYLVHPLPTENESVRYPLTGKTVPVVPGVVLTSIHTPHIKRVPNISHYRHQAVFVQPVQRQNSTTDFRLTFRQWIAGLTYSLATSYAIQTSHTPTYRLLLACIHLAKVAVNILNAIVRLGQYGTRRRLAVDRLSLGLPELVPPLQKSERLLSTSRRSDFGRSKK